VTGRRFRSGRNLAAWIGLVPKQHSTGGKERLDYDGNGRVDLRHSVPDVLASTANLLKTNGWQAGAPFTAGHAEFRGGDA
jgi:transposase